jgi:serine/threonine protein kinase
MPSLPHASQLQIMTAWSRSVTIAAVSYVGVDKFGSYVIEQELGVGGMASVHLARSPAIANPVALKRLHPHVADNPELVKSFIDEARLARFLKHPNIARVYEFGRIAGTYFIAFEYVPGATVLQLHKHCEANVGRIPVPVVLEIGRQLCDALDHAHNARDDRGEALHVVHRDVSPSNMIVSDAGVVKLIDFGLAKAKQQSAQSVAGVIKGKVKYVSPEYLRGKLDARSDLWAVGVVLHELLTGRHLFDGDDDFATLERVRLMAIPPPSTFNPEVSRGLDEILLTALDRDPAHRWQSAAALRAALADHARPGLAKSQLIAWVEWAFSQKQRVREDSGASALHEILESGQVQEVVDEESDVATVMFRLPALAEAMEERRRESVSTMLPIGAALLERRARRRWLWLAVAAVVLAIVAAAMVFRGD